MLWPYYVLACLRLRGGRKEHWGFHWGVYKGAPVRPGIPALEELAAWACRLNTHVFCATTLWHDKVWVKADRGEPKCKSFNTPDIPALSTRIKNKRAGTGKHVLTANLLLVWIDVLFSFWQPHVFYHLRSSRWLVCKIKPQHSSCLMHLFTWTHKNQSACHSSAVCHKALCFFFTFAEGCWSLSPGWREPEMEASKQGQKLYHRLRKAFNRLCISPMIKPPSHSSPHFYHVL